MAGFESNAVIPRAIPEGSVPLISVEGTAYECGRRYGEMVTEKYPEFTKYLDMALDWRTLSPEVKRLFARCAPHILDVYRGLLDAADQTTETAAAPDGGDCTSFGVSGAVTLDGQPISGQTKDTGVQSALLYIVLRMRIKGAPGILVLAYPGEVLGYGLWSTGMSIFRNSLHSSAGSEKGLTMVQWGLLALAGKSVHEAVELARKHGIAGSGNCLISDPQGESLSVEFNAGGVSVVPAKDGIATHANHPEGEETKPFEQYPDKVERDNSAFRMNGLWELLNSERGRLTPQRAHMFLADHSRYPRGICRHIIGDDRQRCTTATVVAEPTKGRLHVTRGPACSNWPVTYAL